MTNTNWALYLNTYCPTPVLLLQKSQTLKMGIKVQGKFFLGPKAVYGIDESAAVNTVTAVWRLGCCWARLVETLEKSSSLSQLHCPHLKNKEVDWLDILRSIGLHRLVVLEKTLESPLEIKPVNPKGNQL